MQLFEDPKAFQAACVAARREGDLGFVPTMGFLHEGHESLMRLAAQHRTSALSIFVNPSQFGPNEDLARYPRDLEGDLRKAEECGIDLVLAPKDPAAIYPAGFQTWVEPGAIASTLEGEHRPGHFRGVATVVLKLLQLSQATDAYFGRKDYQQLALVQRLATDFDLPVRIVGAPTVREPDGLAKSSRNVYLSPEERRRALCLWRAQQAARMALSSGETRASALEAIARAEVEKEADRIDYVAVRDAFDLSAIDHVAPGRAVILFAAVVGRTRLIDNGLLEAGA
jgi:pantoate--beta-alanine ligase